MVHYSHLPVCQHVFEMYHGPEYILREGADRVIKLWDGDTGQFIHTFQGHTEGISDIAWTSDGEYLASASDDKTIKIWSIELVS